MLNLIKNYELTKFIFNYAVKSAAPVETRVASLFIEQPFFLNS